MGHGVLQDRGGALGDPGNIGIAEIEAIEIHQPLNAKYKIMVDKRPANMI